MRGRPEGWKGVWNGGVEGRRCEVEGWSMEADLIKL